MREKTPRIWIALVFRTVEIGGNLALEGKDRTKVPASQPIG